MKIIINLDYKICLNFCNVETNKINSARLFNNYNFINK